jgi:peroxiredoxin
MFDTADTSHAPAVGDPAPPLSLPTIDGDVFDLATAPAQPVLVSFLRHAG